jgi:hypothetical protein
VARDNNSQAPFKIGISSIISKTRLKNPVGHEVKRSSL